MISFQLGKQAYSVHDNQEKKIRIRDTILICLLVSLIHLFFSDGTPLDSLENIKAALIENYQNYDVMYITLLALGCLYILAPKVSREDAGDFYYRKACDAKCLDLDSKIKFLKKAADHYGHRIAAFELGKIFLGEKEFTFRQIETSGIDLKGIEIPKTKEERLQELTAEEAFAGLEEALSDEPQEDNSADEQIAQRQYLVGKKYIDSDLGKSLRFFKMAAESGHKGASFMLKNFAKPRVNLEEARRYLKIAAQGKKGDHVMHAAYQYGRMCHEGLGGEDYPMAALQSLEKALKLAQELKIDEMDIAVIRCEIGAVYTKLDLPADKYFIEAAAVVVDGCQLKAEKTI